MIPGEILHGDGDIEINSGRTPIALTVRNTGDRPIQVGSHFHFAESNAALDFDRTAAWGHRLAVPAGTSVRFEPGMPRDITLIPLAGARIVPGLRGLAAGPLDPPPPTPGFPITAPQTTTGPATTSPQTTTGPATTSPQTTTGQTPTGPATTSPQTTTGQATTAPATTSPQTTTGPSAAGPQGAALPIAPPPSRSLSDISDLSPSTDGPENGSSR